MLKHLGIMLVTVAVALAGPLEEMKAEVHTKEDKSLPFRWTKLGAGKAPAMVVFLHGAGERGGDNKAQLKHGVSDLLTWIQKNNESAVVVAPQCNKGVWWADASNVRSPEGAKLAKETSMMLTMVFEVVDRLAKENQVDPKRIYITGLSMGGFGTFASVARRPDFFAAAIPVCGGGDPSTAGRMKKVPFRVFHGDADSVVPVTCSRVMVNALKKAGADVELTEYPGVRHDSWTETYKKDEVLKWLFAQKKK
ncbi:MAG: prolyl oligopeptidase family serine peptidase [Akkermansiaceae bacterium]